MNTRFVLNDNFMVQKVETMVRIVIIMMWEKHLTLDLTLGDALLVIHKRPVI